MIAGVKKLGRTTREYKGIAFSYIPNAKRALPVSLAVRVDGEFNFRRFYTITEAVTFIDNALMNGAHLGVQRNELVITTKVGA